MFNTKRIKDIEEQLNLLNNLSRTLMEKIDDLYKRIDESAENADELVCTFAKYLGVSVYKKKIVKDDFMGPERIRLGFELIKQPTTKRKKSKTSKKKK